MKVKEPTIKRWSFISQNISSILARCVLLRILFKSRSPTENLKAQETKRSLQQTYKTISRDQLTLFHEHPWHQVQSKRDVFEGQLLQKQVPLPVLCLHHKMRPLETCKVNYNDEGVF